MKALKVVRVNKKKAYFRKSMKQEEASAHTRRARTVFTGFVASSGFPSATSSWHRLSQHHRQRTYQHRNRPSHYFQELEENGNWHYITRHYFKTLCYISSIFVAKKWASCRVKARSAILDPYINLCLMIKDQFPGSTVGSELTLA